MVSVDRITKMRCKERVNSVGLFEVDGLCLRFSPWEKGKKGRKKRKRNRGAQDAGHWTKLGPRYLNTIRELVKILGISLC